MLKHDPKTKTDKLLVQNYLVVFLDILGQRRLLREIKDLPTSKSDKELFKKNLKGIFSKVDGIRRLFKTYFESSKSHKPNIDLVPIERREEFIACQKSNAYYYSFSDSSVIAVPLEQDYDNCVAINGVYDALVATIGIGLMTLSAKTPLRGGLDVGVAWQIEGQEIYGPALERAYYFESNLAEYPRFVIGEELLTYILWVENQKGKTRFALYAKQLAGFCREMIVQDTDGRYMLDFIGKRAKEASGNSIEAETVRQARDFVSSQYKKYVDMEDHKLASRYFRLLRYFNSRANLWGLD